MFRKIKIALAATVLVAAMALGLGISPASAGSGYVEVHNPGNWSQYCLVGLITYTSPFGHAVVEVDNLGFGAVGCTTAGIIDGGQLRMDWANANGSQPDGYTDSPNIVIVDGAGVAGPSSTVTEFGCVRLYFNTTGSWSSFQCIGP